MFHKDLIDSLLRSFLLCSIHVPFPANIFPLFALWLSTGKIILADSWGGEPTKPTPFGFPFWGVATAVFATIAVFLPGKGVSGLGPKKIGAYLVI